MEQYKFFLQDLVSLLKEKLESSHDRFLNSNPEEKDFENGVSMGFYEAIDLIKSQAITFSISLDEIGLDDYSLEKFLRSK